MQSSLLYYKCIIIISENIVEETPPDTKKQTRYQAL